MPLSSLVSALEQLELLIERFEQAWQAGTRPALEDYLADTPLDRGVLLRELVHTDLEYRLRAGDAVRVEEYLERFPELENDPDNLLELIEAEYRHRHRLGQQPALAEYLERFPQHGEQLVLSPPAPSNATRIQSHSDAVGGGSLPALVGRYRVDRLLDRGGMGEVVRVIDGDFDRLLALKVLQECYRGQTDLEERFLREARLTGQLQHPGIPPVQEMGRLPDGRPYFIMKLIEGHSLQQLLLERASPQEQQTYYLGVFEQICRTVAYAHARGIIHRDLKPGNVMVGAFGEVQVMDWGLARVLPSAECGMRNAELGQELRIPHSTFHAPHSSATHPGDVMGTPAYMAPEQARGEVEKLDAGCDVFGLGGILCDLLTGQPPFVAGSNLENQRRAMKGDLSEAFARLDGCGADAELITLAKRCLAPERRDRPADANVVAQAVAAYQEVVRERWRQAEVAQAEAQVRVEEERKRLRVERQKRRVTLLLAGVVLVVLVAGIVGTTVALLRAREQAEIARKVKESLVGVLRSPDPYVAGDTVTVAEVLKEAEEQIDRLDQPLQEELLAAVGQTCLNLKLPDAIKVWKKVVALQTQRLGVDHPDTLTGMNKLATAYRIDGQFEKALPLYEETLQKQKARRGADHPDTLSTMNELGVAYRNAGQLEKALPLLEEALERSKAKLGPEHLATLDSMDNLAGAYQGAGQWQKALPLFEETLEKTRAKLGPDHPDTLISMNNLALAYRDAGQLQKARMLFEVTLEKSKVRFGPDHAYTLNTLHNLATAYHAAGELTKALPLYEETLDKQKARRGADHPRTLITMENLAAAYQDAGMPDRAGLLLRELLDRRRKKDGPEALMTAVASANLGLHLLKQGQYDDAEPLLRESVAVHEKKQPEGWMMFHTRSVLGGVLLGRKKYAEAEPLLLDGYAGMKQRESRIPLLSKPRLTEALDRLVQLYDAWDKKDEAARWRALSSK
jgi:tetratricopeptide (TPR) repeat protein